MVGKLSILVGLIYGVLRIITHFAERRATLHADLGREQVLLPQVVGKTLDKLESSLKYFDMTDELEKVGRENAREHAEAALAHMEKMVSPLFLPPLRGCHTVFRGKVVNHGKKTLKGVQLKIPGMLWAVRFYDGQEKKIDTVDGVLNLGELSPKTTVPLCVWSENRSWGSDLNDCTLIHTDGIGKINHEYRVGFWTYWISREAGFFLYLVLVLIIVVFFIFADAIKKQAVSQPPQQTPASDTSVGGH